MAIITVWFGDICSPDICSPDIFSLETRQATDAHQTFAPLRHLLPRHLLTPMTYAPTTLAHLTFAHPSIAHLVGDIYSPDICSPYGRHLLILRASQNKQQESWAKKLIFTPLWFIHLLDNKKMYYTHLLRNFICLRFACHVSCFTASFSTTMCS